MLDILEIQTLIDHTVKVKLARDNEREKDKSKMPFDYKEEYYPNYNYMIKLYWSVRIHFDNRVIPMHLFSKRSPNQTEKEADWLLANYKQITGAVAADYTNTVARCFIQGNFSISYQPEPEGSNAVLTNNTYEAYVTENFGPYGSIMNYVRNFLPPVKAQDANGVIAIRPKEIPTQINDEGELVVSSVDLPEPLPYYYDISRLVGYEDGVYAMIETPEKSIVEVDGDLQKTGLVYEVYDNSWIYRIEQTGKKSDNDFNIIQWYEHGANEVPVKKLMGIAGIDDNQIVYQSPFMLGTALLEEAILDNGYLQMIKASVVFPHKIILASKCEFEETNDNYSAACHGGQMKGTYLDGGSYLGMCPNCHGQGMISRMAPFGTMYIKPSDQFDQEGDEGVSEPIKFVSPPLESPKMLREEIELNIGKSRGILHLNTTTGEAKGREDATATAKALDLKNLISFVAPISAQTWEVTRFIFKMVGIMRYKDDFRMPDITEPQDFDFKSQSDYLADIKEASESGNVPYPVIAELLRRYIKSTFHGEKTSVQVLNLLTNADRLLTVSQEAIDMGVARNEIAAWEVVLHQSGLTFISELISDNAEFLDLEQSEQVEQLKQKAVEATNSVREIRRKELEEAVNKDGISDAEAEARAKLKGTVGGVQGIIEINRAVFAGEMTEAAGESLLVQIYGFEADIAASMIEKGTPNEVKTRAEAAISNLVQT